MLILLQQNGRRVHFENCSRITGSGSGSVSLIVAQDSVYTDFIDSNALASVTQAETTSPLSLVFASVFSYIRIINSVINLILSRDGKNLIIKFFSLLEFLFSLVVTRVNRLNSPYCRVAWKNLEIYVILFILIDII